MKSQFTMNTFYNDDSADALKAGRRPRYRLLGCVISHPGCLPLAASGRGGEFTHETPKEACYGSIKFPRLIHRRRRNDSGHQLVLISTYEDRSLKS